MVVSFFQSYAVCRFYFLTFSFDMSLFFIFFFFQAEDGIRYIGVTGVQTCALPICPERGAPERDADLERQSGRGVEGERENHERGDRRADALGRREREHRGEGSHKIGRASCRERVKISVVAVSLKNT